MNLQTSAFTHCGQRAHNEDAFGFDLDTKVFVVADGMGGHSSGEVASSEAVDTILSTCSTNNPDKNIPKNETIAHQLQQATLKAHQNIIDLPNQGCGTTVVAAALSEDKIHVLHIGDSRLYRLRNGQLSCLTEDHSLYNELLKSGTELPEKADFVYKHVITRALGLKQQDQSAFEAAHHDLRTGDLFLLCTDGLYDPLGDELIATHLNNRSNLSLDRLCQTLVEMAFAHEGSDNITAMLIRVS